MTKSKFEELKRDPDTGKILPAEPAAKPIPEPEPEPKPKPKPTPKPKLKKFVAVRSPMWHPFAKVHIPMGPPGVLLDEPDSWLQSQIDANLIKELK